MRLEEKAVQPKVRAIDVIGREVEPSAEVDFAQLVFEKAEALLHEIKTEEEFFAEGFNESLVYSLSHVRLLEDILKVDILGADRERLLELALPIAERAQRRHYGPQSGDIVSETTPPTILVGSLQLFPELRSRTSMLDDAHLETAKQILVARKAEKNITAFVMMLCVLRPDKKGELAALVQAEDFQEMWNGRLEGLKSRMLGFFLGTYAAFLLLHPEERSRFTLSEGEKQELIQGIRAGDFPGSQFTSILKNAVIVLGQNAEIDERGKIQVIWGKTRVAPEVPLPLRPQV